MKALIVEDDFTCRLLMQKLLQPYGDCQIAEDGRAGLVEFKKSLDANSPYDLICLDIMMPEMDGQTLLRNIREIEDSKPSGQKRRVKIIMTTALGDKRNVFEAFREQCDAYITKPIHKDKLVEILDGFGFKAPV